jgi:hypothetical protein
LLLMFACPPRTQVGGATVTVRDEAQAQALFQECYRNTPSLLAGQIERRIIGGDWGANGFTTMAQADTLARELGLSAADRLLDLGTGRGWPGLYLAAKTGCRVVLADPPLEGLPPRRSPPRRRWRQQRTPGVLLLRRFRVEPRANGDASSVMTRAQVDGELGPERWMALGGGVLEW